MNHAIDLCDCGRRKKATAEMCRACKQKLGLYDSYNRDTVSLRDLIYGRIIHPGVAEKMLAHALAVQARVSGVSGRDSMGRENHQAKGRT